MKYREMYPLSETEEYINMLSGKKCQMTTEQKEKVRGQVESLFGDTDFEVSLKGVVFSKPDFKNTDEVHTLGRIDRLFNFVPKN